MSGHEVDRQYISPLHIHDGFVYGWVQLATRRSAEVHLWMDGNRIATEYTGHSLPPACHRACGRPPREAKGFAIALPSAALDGFAHDLHVSVSPGDDEPIHGAVQVYGHGKTRGEITQQGRQFVGTVWFDRPPGRDAALIAKNHLGEPVASQPLHASATREPSGYPARFAVACESLPAGPLHFSCAGQELRGSPCSRVASVIGVLEEASATALRGWAFDSADVGRPLELCVRVDGRPVSWFRPNTRRPEIEARLGSLSVALIGFDVPLPEGLADGRPHRLEVVAADDGELLKQGQQILRFEPAWVELVAGTRPIAPRPPVAPLDVPVPGDAPLVSLVVLNRNGEAVLSSFLESWSRHNTVPAEIIVIDHASTDGSLAVLEQWRRRLDLTVLALDRNDSFSASSNLGASRARGEYLLFMNNDIEWLQDALPPMLSSLQRPEVGIVGLKLLKSVGESEQALHPATEVQHLGVRFKVSGGGYWPYEVGPSVLRAESEYSPQVVPVVTGAVLLCRKADFEEVGGFDTAYFYGFEDVEFCLRLSHRLGKLVVSRNDLTALHRHGHTRLSGREISLFDRVQANARVLESHLGLWIKQAYWRSLLQGDGYMTTESFTIGLVTEPIDRDSALRWAQDLTSGLPGARVVLLPPERDWKNVDGLHVLVVATRQYDIRTLRNARPDLLTIAWVRSCLQEWQALPWWHTFGGHLHDTGARGSQRGAAATASAKQTPSSRLPALLACTSWRLRTAVHIPLTDPQFAGDTPVARKARELLDRLRQGGLPCWPVPLEKWDSDTTMADACITLQGTLPAAAWTPRSDVLNVLWLCEEGAKVPADWQPRHGRVCREEPSPQWLAQAMEESVGSTFHPS